MVDESHCGWHEFIEEIKPDGIISVQPSLCVMRFSNASYIGFTGMPTTLDGRNTREVFGDYVDVYDMTQAVENGGTVSVCYSCTFVRG